MSPVATESSADTGLDACSMVTVESLLPVQWTTELDDHVLDLQWSPNGLWLAAIPSTGRPVVFAMDATAPRWLPEHGGGNDSLSWHPHRPRLVTFGQDGELRFYEEPFRDPVKVVSLGKGWATQVLWNADGTLLAAAVGRTVFVLEADSARVLQKLDAHDSTVGCFAWHPVQSDELVTVCHGGARLWRLGQNKAVSQFSDAGASTQVSWSPDARWMALADHLSTVHFMDAAGKQKPLHIAGYSAKVKALAWLRDSSWLATAGGQDVVVWPFHPDRGPHGAKPKVLRGHVHDVLAFDFACGEPILASGGKDGLLLMWLPERTDDPALIYQCNASITAVAWSCDGRHLTFGTDAGTVFLCRAFISSPTETT